MSPRLVGQHSETLSHKSQNKRKPVPNVSSELNGYKDELLSLACLTLSLFPSPFSGCRDRHTSPSSGCRDRLTARHFVVFNRNQQKLDFSKFCDCLLLYSTELPQPGTSPVRCLFLWRNGPNKIMAEATNYVAGNFRLRAFSVRPVLMRTHMNSG